MIEISAALTTGRTLLEWLRGANKLIHDVDQKMAIADAIEKVLDMQSALLQANEKVSALLQQIKDMNDWKVRATNYQLVKIGGSVVYKSLTDSPVHFACPSCFEKYQQIQPLQDTNNAFELHECPGCKSSYAINPFSSNVEGKVLRNIDR